MTLKIGIPNGTECANIYLEKLNQPKTIIGNQIDNATLIVTYISFVEAHINKIYI